MLYLCAFVTVVLLDILCVKYVLRAVPKKDDGARGGGNISFLQASVVTLTSAVVIGILLLEIMGSLLIVNGLESAGMSHTLALRILKNAYMTLAPLLNAMALILWSRWIPALGYRRIWPDALVAGTILHYIDYGIVVPWFFRLAEALATP